MPTPAINQDLCTKCKACIEICPMEVFKEEDKILVAKPEECIGCKACEVHCPKSAIQIKD